MINDLKSLQIVQRMFEEDNGRNATNFTELLPYLGQWFKTNYHVITYSAESNRWFASVDASSGSQGYYLFADDKLYFNELRPATTNDFFVATLKIDSNFVSQLRSR